MNRYPDNELTFTEMVLRAIRLHYLTLKYTIVIIIALTLLKSVLLTITRFFPSDAMQYLITLIAILGVTYLVSVALLSTHQAFIDQPKSLNSVLKTTLERLPMLYATLALYILGSVVVYYFVKLLLMAIAKLINEPSPMHAALLLIGISFVVGYFVIFSFALPLCLIEKKSLRDAFYESLLLTEKNKFGVFMLFMIFGAMTFLVLPNSIHEHLLNLYHLDLVFDLIALSVAFPIFINLFLIVMNNCQREFTLESEPQA